MRPVRVDSAKDVKDCKRLITAPIPIHKDRLAHLFLNCKSLISPNDAGDPHLRLVSNWNSIYVL